MSGSQGSSGQLAWYSSMESNFSVGDQVRGKEINQILMRTQKWSEEIKSFCRNRAEHWHVVANHDLQEILEHLKQLEYKQEKDDLELEAIASLFSVKERRKLKEQRRMGFIKRDYEEFNRVTREHERVLRLSMKQQQQSSLSHLVALNMYQSGKILTHFGNKLKVEGARILDVGKRARTDKKMETVMLQGNGLPPYVRLANGNMRMSHVGRPKARPDYAVVHANASVCMVPRDTYQGTFQDFLVEIDDVFQTEDILGIVESAFCDLHMLFIGNLSEKVNQKMILQRKMDILSLQTTRNRMLEVQQNLSTWRLHDLTQDFRELMSDAEAEMAKRKGGEGAKSASRAARLRDKLSYVAADSQQARRGSIADHFTVGVAKFRKFSQELLKKLHTQSANYGRYYFEFHLQNPKDLWVVGLVEMTPAELASNEAVAGTSFRSRARVSFGLRQNGDTFDNGRMLKLPHIKLKNFHEVTIVGVMIDVYNGVFSVRKDANEFMRVFGMGSLAFERNEQVAQALAIKSGKMVPTFELMGRSGEASDPSRTSAKRRAKYNRLTGKGVDTSSTEGSARQRSARVWSAHKNTPSSAADNSGEPGFIQEVPKLSVNFGSFEFFDLPLGCVGADHLLNGTDPARGSGVLIDMDWSMPTRIRDVVNGGEEKAKEEADGDDAESVMSGMSGAGVGQGEFMERVQRNLKEEDLVSWSRFPPREMELEQAVLTLQAFARRWMARRKRSKRWNVVLGAVLKIQHIWRVHFGRAIKAKSVAIRPLQAAWRGRTVRKQFALAAQYGVDYITADGAAVRVQSMWRRKQAQRQAMIRAALLEDKLETILTYTILVQRMFRAKKLRSQALAGRKQLEAILTFQKIFRGVTLRRTLHEIDPTRAARVNELRAMRSARMSKTKAAVIVQRYVRGFLARQKASKLRAEVVDEMAVVRDAFRKFVYRDRVDAIYKDPTERKILKVFFDALGATMIDPTDGSSDKFGETYHGSMARRRSSGHHASNSRRRSSGEGLSINESLNRQTGSRHSDSGGSGMASPRIALPHLDTSAPFNQMTITSPRSMFYKKHNKSNSWDFDRQP